jgi:hypothetical protein
MKPDFQNIIQILGSTSLVFALAACGPTTSDQLNTGAASTGVSANESLYVASGACYGGGVVTALGSGTVVAFDPATGNMRRLVVDYAKYSPGDQPVAISNYDATHLLVTVENSSGRRIDLVNKDGSGLSTYLSNSTALSAVLRSASLLSDGSLLVSKSTAIEKFTPSKARVLQGASPFINAPASTCGPAATLITGLDVLSNGKVIFTHSAASPNNKFELISASGYSATTDCLGSQAAPTTLAMPTAVLVHSSGKVLVAYGSMTPASNFVYTYPINATTNVISTAISAYSDSGILVNGPSALAEDQNSTDVFVANALSTMNTIERFSYNSTTGILTPASGRLGPNVYTKCVSAMKVIKN